MDWVAVVFTALAREGIAIKPLAVAAARAAPSIVLLPAILFRSTPLVARGGLGLVLVVSVTAGHPPPAAPAGEFEVLTRIQILKELLRGVPVTFFAAIPIWVATMSGGLVDTLLRGTSTPPGGESPEASSGTMSTLFQMLSGFLFFSTGGPAVVADALAQSGVEGAGWIPSVLTASIRLAVGLVAPILAAAVILDAGCGLIYRLASPIAPKDWLTTVRAFGITATLALTFERIAIELVRLLGA